jgi:light-independent protochlorophyllide reductase subunit B
MFRDDFEFHGDAAASHLGATTSRQPGPTEAPVKGPDVAAIAEKECVGAWAPDAEKELSKIPFFVRRKARRNTERFAADHGIKSITVETLYDAKAYFSR